MKFGGEWVLIVTNGLEGGTGNGVAASLKERTRRDFGGLSFGDFIACVSIVFTHQAFAIRGIVRAFSQLSLTVLATTALASLPRSPALLPLLTG
jgi:hypothetical protein